MEEPIKNLKKVDLPTYFFLGLIIIFKLFLYHTCSIESIMKLTHVRLDREHIMDIDNLEMLGPVTNLYLQQVG